MSLTSPPPSVAFNEYSERFKGRYKMERRDDGVILVQALTLGGPIQFSVEKHRSLGQMLKAVGADPKNELLVLSGGDDESMMASDPEGFVLEEREMAYWAHECVQSDGSINVSSLVNDLKIPTIGALNGAAFPTEICLMCDVSLCTEDTVIYDLHYGIGSVPGDGIHSCVQELLGVKRAAYALLTGETIDAKTALRYGMVNEVLPKGELLKRAYQIADRIMSRPRIVRRMTTQIVRRPWRKRITDDLDGGFRIQTSWHPMKVNSVHGKRHMGKTVDYVRKGKRDNFDK